MPADIDNLHLEAASCNHAGTSLISPLLPVIPYSPPETTATFGGRLSGDVGARDMSRESDVRILTQKLSPWSKTTHSEGMAVGSEPLSYSDNDGKYWVLAIAGLLAWPCAAPLVAQMYEIGIEKEGNWSLDSSGTRLRFAPFQELAR